MTGRKLAVLLGAGASYDVCPERGPIKEPIYRPPLVANLFEERAFDLTLEDYPAAHSIMSLVRTRMRPASGAKFEEVLGDLINNPSPYYQRQMTYVPLAFDSFFRKVSSRYTMEPINYSDLINRTIGQGIHTAYITLNYDTLLEQSLSKIAGRGLPTDDSYVSSSDWMLVKLHGSVGWGYPWASTDDAGNLRDAAAKLGSPERTADRIRVGLPESLVADNELFYPAIALPIAGKYGFVCPPKHIEALAAFLDACESYLFIGLSAQDEDLLEFLTKSVRRSHRVEIVGKDDVEQVEGRLLRGVRQFTPSPQCVVKTFGGGFTAYLEGECDRFISSLGAGT